LQQSVAARGVEFSKDIVEQKQWVESALLTNEFVSGKS
jgi:hypothetical protein